MIALLRKIRKIFRRNKWSNTGKRNPVLDFINDAISNFLTAIIWRSERIKEIVLFIPVIYKALRWDYSSIYRILRHWLSRMEDCQRNDKFHLHSDKRAEEIKLCILILDRLCEDNYLDNALREHDEYWGEIHTWSSPCKEPGYSQWNSARPNVRSPQDMERERKEFRKCIDHEAYMLNQDLDLLFKTIKKHHRGWWC